MEDRRRDGKRLKWYYNEVKDYVESEDNGKYTLLSTEYLGIHKILKIRCNEGHITDISFGSFKDKKIGCKICNEIMKHKTSYNELKEGMGKEGYTLISTFDEYKTRKAKLNTMCPHGHKFKTSHERWFVGNTRCPDCAKINSANSQKLKENTVADFIKKYGFKIDKWIDVCENQKSKFIVECNNGHKYETCFGNLKTSKCGCGECSGMLAHESAKVYEDFKKSGLIPQFEIEDYKNANQRLPYICEIHKEEGIKYKTYSSLIASMKKDLIGCPLCSRDITTMNSRMKESHVFDFMISKGMIPLEGEVYITNATHIKYICNNHKDVGVQTTTWMNLNDGKGCKHCAYDSISGENHYNYKGGITPLQNRVRDSIMKSEWRKQSIKKYNNRCVLTIRTNGNHVHHLNRNFTDILQESLSILNLEVKPFINDYTSYELKSIENLTLELHFKYGEGIVINGDLHKIFHSIYTRQNNTQQQFEEFKTRYYSGEFDEQLEEKLKSYNSIKRIKELKEAI